MKKPLRILTVVSSLSLLAQGTLSFAENELPGSAAAPVTAASSVGIAQSSATETEDTESTAATTATSANTATAATTATSSDPATTAAPAAPASPSTADPAEKTAAQKSSSKATGTKPPIKLKQNYVKEEPVSDPSSSTTRVHRPAQDGTMPPQAPSVIGKPNPASPMPLLPPPPVAPPKERFPSVGQLEQLMFGHSTPNLVVDNRLDKLETAIFQKSSPDLDIEQRIKRLKEVIIGEEARPAPQYNDPDRTALGMPSASTFPPKNLGMTLPDLEREPAASAAPFFPNYGHYDLNQQLSIPEAEKFAVDVLNEVRQQQGLNELSWDEQSHKVGEELITDLVKRDAVSHQNAKGENPDLRYTKAGGSDSLVESLVMFPSADKLRPTRQLVVKMLETLNGRQDDREALMFAHASGFSMAFNWSADKHKLICCTEVVTKHGEMSPLPLEAGVGDKIEVKGSVTAPYKFQRITLAWEGLASAPSDDSSESAEALPYFPPLDYEAHAAKSGRDFDKGIKLLQIAGITAAIAGGIFIPPVALAAPLIAASIGPSTPKSTSEIPTRGGVKTDGANFSRSLTLSNQGKEGIYYVTIWANTGGADEAAVAVSRRAIIARKDHQATDSSDEKEAPKGEEKNGDGKQQAQPASI